MKNLGTLSFCIWLLLSCSTASVKEVKLSNGNSGYDVKCLGDLSKCQQRAKVLCSGKYRIHNTFSDIPLLSALEREDLTMRLQCVNDVASVEQCSQPGVNCVL
jgi:hypothetical protein